MIGLQLNRHYVTAQNVGDLFAAGDIIEVTDATGRTSSLVLDNVRRDTFTAVPLTWWQAAKMWFTQWRWKP